ncbi:GNAT family N-acetyltransferase [Luteolibacter sp. GHJ8]|uniref:GNAT family N-acetyltransferase n=1 Tax=Luteolibacter rhizosphaerae TaxID=2989719 RepID=A0ABT3G332_9BACT|nr:GNAT family N-acetyltransferase [Luteolibacter rhizosphaerae]MCW1913889.1 GNAT family N-acetyltransferase [Luteolibacter rhizosphaerae]
MTTVSDNPGFQIRQAAPGETGVVSGILQEAARWLVESGTPMWKDGELAPDRIAADVEAGLFYLAWAGSKAAGVFKMQPEDPLFWPDLPEGEALYLHRIAVRREFAGQGVMSSMIAFSRDATRQAGRRYLRLDCEAARPRLRAAYERLGFQTHSERQVGPYFVARYQQAIGPANPVGIGTEAG